MVLINFYRSTIGKKVVVALTGALFILFVIGHMLGNLKTFMGVDPVSGVHHLDHYAHFLRSMGHEFLGHGTALWLVRIGLLGALILHVITVFLLRRQNKAARPAKYARQKFSSVSWASYSMWWGGLLILVFIIFHLLHLTTGDLHFDGFKEGAVYANVYHAFQHWYLTLFYVLAMVALAFHLYHGVWSLFQTLGLDRPDRNLCLRRLAILIAVILFIGFISVPVAVFLGLVPEPTAITLEV